MSGDVAGAGHSSRAAARFPALSASDGPQESSSVAAASPRAGMVRVRRRAQQPSGVAVSPLKGSASKCSRFRSPSG